MNKSVASLLLAALVAGLSMTSALAGSRDRETYTARQQNRGEVCQPWCANDTSPCDPPQFKVSDGRCAGLNTHVR